MKKYIDYVLDGAGNGQSSVSVTIKNEAGDNATIYSDDGVTVVSNPLTTDANGEFSFYAINGVYTIQVTGADDRTVELYDLRSSQPLNAFYELVVPEDGDNYADNVLTIENRSLNGSAQRGNAAIRFRDALTGYERGAIGYNALATDNPAFYGGNLLYGEIGNLSTDAQDTDFAVVNTHVSSGAAGFAAGSYKAIEVVGSTGTINIRSAAPSSGSSHIGEGAITAQGTVSLGGEAGSESLRASYVGTPSAYIVAQGIASGGVPTLTVSDSTTDVSLNVRAKNAGTVNIGARGVDTLTVGAVANQVNSWNMYGGATGAQVTITPIGETNVTSNFDSKGPSSIVCIRPNGADICRVTGSGLYLHASTGIPAGGTAGFGISLSSATNFGIFFGSGVPTLSAAQGSLYLRSDGSSTSTRMYVNTNGSTGWTAVTTAS